VDFGLPQALIAERVVGVNGKGSHPPRGQGALTRLGQDRPPTRHATAQAQGLALPRYETALKNLPERSESRWRGLATQGTGVKR
jgi:hypothetical protein